ncbi:MAG: hypothetical protein ABFC78_12475 [Methanoregula sp.]
MTENLTTGVNLRVTHPVNSIGQDGLQENILLLHEISEKLDQYFAMQSWG